MLSVFDALFSSVKRRIMTPVRCPCARYCDVGRPVVLWLEMEGAYVCLAQREQCKQASKARRN